MHELPLVKSIFKSVKQKAEENNASRVVMVQLEIGVLREFVPEIIQKYWDYITPATILENSIIDVVEIPASAQCSQCENVYLLDLQNLFTSVCNQCGCETGTLVTGREMKIKGIQIE